MKWRKKTKKHVHEIKISYSIIDSSSIINIDLTSYTDLASWWNSKLFLSHFYCSFRRRLSISFPEKLFGKLLLRKTEITYSGWSHKLIFFSQLLLLTVIYASGLDVHSLLISSFGWIGEHHKLISDVVSSSTSFDSTWWKDVWKKSTEHYWSRRGNKANKLCNQTWNNEKKFSTDFFFFLSYFADQRKQISCIIAIVCSLFSFKEKAILSTKKKSQRADYFKPILISTEIEQLLWKIKVKSWKAIWKSIETRKKKY